MSNGQNLERLTLNMICTAAKKKLLGINTLDRGKRYRGQTTRDRETDIPPWNPNTIFPRHSEVTSQACRPALKFMENIPLRIKILAQNKMEQQAPIPPK